MRYLYFIPILLIASASNAIAQSTLLENVKNNPKEAQGLCKQFYQSESVLWGNHGTTTWNDRLDIGTDRHKITEHRAKELRKQQPIRLP